MHSLYPLKGMLGPGRVLVAGSFTTINGAGAVVEKGSGFTVARTAEGAWTVTIKDPSVRIDSVTLSIAAETLTSFALLMEDQDARTTSVFKILCFSTANCSTTNFAASDEPGAEISFMAVCKDTTTSDF